MSESEDMPQGAEAEGSTPQEAGAASGVQEGFSVDASAGSPADASAVSPAEAFTQQLSATALPVWRKAYLANLIASGKRFAEGGNPRGADYCFAKVEEALRGQAAPAASTTVPALPSAPPARPSDRMRSRWREDRIGHAESVLRTHGARLSPLEKQSYRDRLEKLREEAGQPSQAVKSDAGLLDLRRRLYQRVLKAQKISLHLKRAPAAERPARKARPSATPTAWQTVTGPYNDKSNIEELLSVISAADPAWVEEFLELYGSLTGLNALLTATISKQ